MNPEETAAATGLPIARMGLSYFGAEQVGQAMGEAGFSGFTTYFGGRGGVLGNVASDVVVSAFALFHPAVIEGGWNQTKEQGSPSDASDAFATGIGRWASDTFGHLDGLGEFAAAARAVFDAATPRSQALYAGWRAMPVPDDPAAAAGLAIQVLRELRFGFHVHGLTAVGMSPVEAILVQTDSQHAQFFGWSEPFPDPETLRDKHGQAEEITSARMAEVYETIDADQRTHFVATIKAIAKITSS